MSTEIFNMGSSFYQMISIEKFVDTHDKEVTIGSMLTYTIVLENISKKDLESVCVVEDLISGLKYKKGTLKINGLRPYGGDIDLDENVIIPIGDINAKSQNSYTNSKIVITFNVLVDKVPCQQPIFNYARVIFKYYKNGQCLTGIETSNKVLVPFNLFVKDEGIMKLVEGRTIVGKGPGDSLNFIILLEPDSPMENVILSDYLDKRLELISVKVIRNGVIEQTENTNIRGLKLGYIDKGERLEVLINTRIREYKDYSCDDCNSGCEIISNQATIKYVNPFNKYYITKDTNKVYVYVYSANIKAYKSVDRDRVNIDDIITYKIHLRQCGSTIIENIILKDKLPSSLQYIKNSAEIVYYSDDFKSEIDYDPIEGIVRIPVLDIGEEVSIYLKGKVVSNQESNSNKIINRAYLTYSYLKYPDMEDESERYYTVIDQPITKTEPICVNSADLLSTLNKEAVTSCSCSCTSIDYKIEFTNTGNLCARNVNIRDFISDGATLDTTSLQVTTNRPPGPKEYKGSLPNITIYEVHSGETIVIRFKAIVDLIREEKIIENYADLTYQYTPCNCKKPIIIEGKTNTTSTKIASRKISSKLTINNQINTSIEVGQEAFYRVEIKNISSEELTNVVYELQLDSNLNQYIKYKEGSLVIKGVTPPTTNINPNINPIEIGTIKSFETVIIEFIEIALKETTNPIISYLRGRYSYKDGSEITSCTDETNKATLMINGQMVKVIKEAYSYCPPQLIGCVPKKIDSISPGERITYRVTITNVSSKRLEDVSLEDILPPEVSYVPNSLKINGEPVTEDLFPVLYLGNINQGETIIVEFDVIVDKNISSSSIVNTACVDYFYIIDPGACKRMKGKSCAINEIDIKGPNFKKSFSKYVEKVGQVEEFKSPSNSINYIIQFKNEGNEDAFNVVLSDTLPNEVGYILDSITVTPSVPPSNIKQPNGLDRLLQVKVDTVSVGQMYTIQWTVIINSTFTQGDIINNADLSYSYVTNSAGNTTRENITSNNVVTHVRSAQLEITKAATPTITDTNVPINYTIEMKNKGNVIANNIFLSDFLPGDDLEYIPGTLRVNGLPTSFDINTGILIGSLNVYNPVTDSPKAVVTYQLVSKVPPLLNPVANKASATYTYTVNPFTNEEVNALATSNLALVQINAADFEFVKPTKRSSEFIVSNTDQAKNNANYEITLVNSGNITGLNVIIQDTLPNGLDFVPNTVTISAVDANGKQIPVKVNSIPPGEPLNIENGINIEQVPAYAKLITTFTYQANGSERGLVDNTSQYSYSYITSQTLINKPTRSTDKETILIVDDLLDVTKSASPSSFCEEQVILYNVRIRNISGGTISNVILQDTIPDSTKFIEDTFSVDSKPFTINGATVTNTNLAKGINIGTIPINGSKDVQFQVKVNDIGIPDVITNTAVVNFISTTITSKLYESTSTISRSTACPQPRTFPIEMEKIAYTYCPPELTTCTPISIENTGVGDRITYKTSVQNIDTTTVSNIVFSDVLPPELSYVNNTLKVDGVTVTSGSLNGLNLGTLPAGKSFLVEFDALVNSIPEGNEIINAARTTYKYFINCPACTLTNGRSGALNILSILSPDLFSTFKKSVGSIGTTSNLVGAGRNLPYFIEFSNTGTQTATNVVLKDVIPQELTYVNGSVSVTPPISPQNIIEPTTNNPTLTINIGTVTIGQGYSIKFNTIAPNTISSTTIVNSADLNYSYITDVIGNVATVSGSSNQTFTNIINPKVSLVKSANPTDVDINTPVTYTITLTNTGNITVNNLYLSEIISPELQFIEDTLTINGFPIPVNPLKGLILGALGVYDPKTQSPQDVVKFDVSAPSIPLSNPLINIAKANYNYIVDPDTGERQNGENVSNEAQVFVYAADLNSVPPTKVSNKKIFYRSDTVNNTGEYSINIVNSGNRSALNVKVTDTLPNGLLFVPQSVTVTGYDLSGNIVPLVVNSIPPGGPLNIESGILIDNIYPQVKATIRFSYKVESNAPSQIDNKAVFDYSYISTNTIVNKLNNSTNIETIYVLEGNQGLTKLSSPQEVCPGQTVLYTIIMDNTIGTTLSNVVLQDTIPCGTHFVPSSFTINFRPAQVYGRPVTGKMLTQGIYLSSIPAGGRLVAQYQATVSCKCHPNPIENIANLTYDGGKFSAISITTVGNGCICNCNQYCDDYFCYQQECNMCYNRDNQFCSNENYYNKSTNKNNQSNWKKIRKNTDRVNR